MIIYIAGSGGKTSLMHELAEKYQKQGRKVLLVTTTHMFAEKGCILYEDPVSQFSMRVRDAWKKRNIVQAGRRAEDGKIAWIGSEAYEEIRQYADVILIEADGSKGMPAKVPNDTEPVIGQDADSIYVVFGLLAIGKKGQEVCHRFALAKEIIGDEETISQEAAARILKEAYIEPCQRKYPQAEITLVLNQADNERLKESGRAIAEKMPVPVRIVSLKKEGEN